MPVRFRLVVLASLLVGGMAAAMLSGRAELPIPPSAVATDPTAVVPETPPAPAERLETVSLRRGDTLVTALRRAGVGLGKAHEVAAALTKAGANLRRLRPGEGLEITWDPADQPAAVTWHESPWLSYAAVSEGDGWVVKRLETTPDVRVGAVQGRVESSLFEAIDVAGETPALVLAMVGIFESDFDFTADTRQGDRFRLLVEKRYAGDTFVNYGRLLAAQYESGERTLTGIGFLREGEKFGYYDLAGLSMRKTFLKSPLEFSRITSGFTYARPHPILGGVRPHLAIDYGAPVGTPVRAVADGVVRFAGWNGGNGIQVHLRHRSGYETLYNHLSRVARGLRPGSRVTQRQVIGYVGATGLATGPHLDYRVARNGVFVNPMSEKFLPGEPIPPRERAAFSRYAKSLLSRLDDEAPF